MVVLPLMVITMVIQMEDQVVWEEVVEMVKALVETHKHQAVVVEEEILMVVQEEKFGLL